MLEVSTSHSLMLSPTPALSLSVCMYDCMYVCTYTCICVCINNSVLVHSGCITKYHRLEKTEIYK